MIRYIELINRIFNSKIISTVQEDDLNQLVFFKENKCLFSFDDKRLMQKLFRVKFFDRFFFNIENTTLYGKSGYIFIKSLNGFLILDLINLKVYKVLEQTLEPEFVKHEIRASGLNKINPKILDHFVVDNYNVLIQKLLVNEKKISWKSWKNHLNKVFNKIIVAQNKITKVTSDNYILEIVEKLNNIGIEELYLLEYQEKIKSDLLYLIDKYNNTQSNLFKIFMHGDLTPNNVIINNNEYILIDFANGGLLNFTYDLMLQNFYFTESLTWKNFDKINFKNNRDKRIFFGLTQQYIEKIEDVYDLDINENTIKLSIIISLAEIFIKNYYRYQSLEEWEDGIGMLLNVEKICKNIKES